MLNALLLPLLLAGAPVGQNDDPAVQLWISNDRRFLPGDRAKVHVRAREDGYLVVLHADPDGHLRVLFPLDPDDDNFVRGGRRYEVRDRGGREAFDADRTGRGMVYAAVSRAPFRFEGYVLGDHWDYRALAPDRLPRDPEAELTDIARRMAGGSFDYDVLTYDVLERVVYASNYSYSRPYYNSYYYDGWCGGYWSSCGSGISVGIYFGRPYRYSWHDPYWYGYNPYYDPFFYDPYYYRPAYYYPVHRHYYYRPYYYPRYRDYWRYDSRYRDYGRPYTPYRFRGAEGSQADFRDRNYGFRRAVNTVYTPPVSRFTEPDRATPMRRVVEEPAADRPTEARREATRREPAADRREPAAERREPAAERREPAAERREPAARRTETARPRPAEQGKVEARRAREREPERGTMRDAREYRSESRPQEVRGRRADDSGRPSIERAPIRNDRPELPEARPARRAEDRPSESRAEPRYEPRSEPRAEPRSEPRAEPRYEPRSAPAPAPRGDGGGRVERSSPPPSSGHDGGGRRPSGSGGGGGGGGGGRRR